jgi:hypothetical protein
MTDSPELHDFSRLDAHMAARRRATVLHSLWRPLLAGAVASLAVSAAIFVVLPKVSYREIEVPKVSYVPTEVPRIEMKDLEVQHIVPRDVVIEIPKIVTKAEHDFISRPEFETAQFKGRLVYDPDGLIKFDSGAVFVPVKYDPVSGHQIQDFDAEYVTAPYLGDWAFCNAIPASENLFKCLAVDHDVVVDLATTRRPKGQRS